MCKGNQLYFASKQFSLIKLSLVDFRHNFQPTPEELAAIAGDFDSIYTIPENFQVTSHKHDPRQGRMNRVPDPQMCINPQTALLCEMLNLTNPFAVFMGKQQHNVVNLDTSIANASLSCDDTGDSDFIDTTIEVSAVNSTLETTTNPDEISIDDIDESDSDSKEAAVSQPVQSPALSLRDKLSQFAPPLNSTPNPQKPDSSPCSDTCDKESHIDSSAIETHFSLDDSKTTDEEHAEFARVKSSERLDGELSDKRSSDELDTTCPRAIAPGAKKLKRRNQSLYAPVCTNTESDECWHGQKSKMISM